MGASASERVLGLALPGGRLQRHSVLESGGRGRPRKERRLLGDRLRIVHRLLACRRCCGVLVKRPLDELVAPVLRQLVTGPARWQHAIRRPRLVHRLRPHAGTLVLIYCELLRLLIVLVLILGGEVLQQLCSP